MSVRTVETGKPILHLAPRDNLSNLLHVHCGDWAKAIAGCCRSRRAWKPNVITKAVYSEALDRMVRLNMTTAALRSACILTTLSVCILQGYLSFIRSLRPHACTAPFLHARALIEALQFSVLCDTSYTSIKRLILHVLCDVQAH